MTWEKKRVFLKRNILMPFLSPFPPTPSPYSPASGPGSPTANLPYPPTPCCNTTRAQVFCLFIFSLSFVGSPSGRYSSGLANPELVELSFSVFWILIPPTGSSNTPTTVGEMYRMADASRPVYLGAVNVGPSRSRLRTLEKVWMAERESAWVQCECVTISRCGRER